MRKLMLALMLVVAMTMVIGSSASAANVYSQTIPLTGLPVNVGNLCPAIPPMTVTGGSLRLAINATADSSGGEHFGIRINTQGVTAVVNDSNVMYNISVNASITANLTAGGATDVTVNAKAALVGKGRAPNWNGHLVLHLTANANGDLTATVLQIQIDNCY